MSSASKRIFLSARLPGFTGRGDKYLGEIAQELRRVLLKTQNTFVYPACQLPDAAWSDVAVLLVEWAEDVHNDIGLWRTVETHQRRCFGTPLPLIVNESPEVEPHGFDPLRIRFFLWSLWPCFNPEQVLSPAHADLKRLAEAASRLLAERFARLPRDSGVTRFLASPNEYGWDMVEGRLRTETWNNEGTSRSQLILVCDSVQFVVPEPRPQSPSKPNDGDEHEHATPPAGGEADGRPPF